MAPQPISAPSSEASSSFSSGAATPPPSASSARLGRSLPAQHAASSGAAACKLFIGGLSSQTTHEVLRAHFSQYGRLVDAVVMTKNGRPRGFGFVAFDSPEGAAAVLAEPQWLDGRFVDVKRAVPGEHAQERPSNKIFVGGLPQDATTEDLRACFASYGPVSDAVVMVDRRTKRSRGFGFVRFAGGAQGSAAAEAVLMDAASHRLGGKWIEVKKATPAALLRELSPSSAGEASSPTSAASTAASSASSTPTAAAAQGVAAARGRGGVEQRQRRQQQQEQEQQEQEEFGIHYKACLYYEFLAGAAAAANSSARAGGDAATWTEPSAAAAALAALSAMGGLGDDAAAMAAASDLGAGGKSHARGRRGRRSRRGTACADEEQGAGAAGVPALAGLGEEGFAGWTRFDMSSFGRTRQFEACSNDTMNEPSTPKASNENKPGLANGASSQMQCPPGLGINASPMKVPCRNKNLEEGVTSAFTREDFLSLEVRPWLSAW